ncbi:kelch-like protein 12 isoform X2 [Clavelina lepadiformis]|uniref:kelch-like protein 12 isoform X2 n=1 Tax=Clavelina lepadiformis TaxID=159417 RepID=UPI0040417C0E
MISYIKLEKMEFNNNHHATEIISNLNEERKTTKDFCDFTIKAGGTQFPVHKCVVGSFSEYFKKMFTTKMKESYSNEGSVKEVSGPTMASIINFIYTSCIILTHDNVYDVLEAAEYLRITSLKEYCRKFFKASLNGESCLKIRSYSNRYNMGDVVQAAETFISKNLGAVLKSSDFLQFNVDDAMAMLKLESEQDSIDEDKYRSVVSWTKYSLDERRKHFNDLFLLVQLNSLSQKFLNEVVHREELVNQSADSMNLLVTALFARIPGNIDNKDNCQSDDILIIGGLVFKQNVVKFNTKTKQWSDMPDTNIDRFCPSAVNYNQQILLMGGKRIFGNTYYNTVEMLDLNDENPKWDSNLPSMREKRQGFASALLNGLVYCTGGWNDAGFLFIGPLSSCESYNPEERKWSSIRNMNKTRTDHALVSARGLLYALGGLRDGNNATHTAECYDPRNGKWKYIPPMKTCRSGLTAVVLNNEIYAIGGHDGSNGLSTDLTSFKFSLNLSRNFSSVEKFNLDTKTWTDVASMKEKRCGGSACVVDGLIWVFGGVRAKTVEFYDPAANKWQVSTNMDRQRWCPCVLSI